MHFYTQVSQISEPAAAIQALTANMAMQQLACLYFYYTEEYSAQILWQELTYIFPGIPIIGCSSFKGVMTEAGYFEGPVVALMAVYASSQSVFTTGFAEFTDQNNLQSEVGAMINQALTDVNRLGEVPGLIVLHATPGYEEEIIQAIDQIFGTPVPIIGGSAADHHIESHWSVMSDKGWSHSGMVIQLSFSHKLLATGFSAGYFPTEFIGTVTRSQGRLLEEIDGIPAREMYIDWVSDHSGVGISDEYLFNHVTCFPLGRLAGFIDGQPYYKLTHPIRVTANGGLELFANVQTGENITLMTGSRTQLINRVVRVIKEANAKNYADAEQLGSITIFCAGAMARLGDDILRVQEQTCQLLNYQPFICPFTFGEQGRFADGENAHGNLMISSVVFYKSELISL